MKTTSKQNMKSMKKIITIIVLSAGMLSFAQEAGKKGELLKNEATVKEMQTITSSNTSRGMVRSDNTSKDRIPSRNNGRNNNVRYNWNQNLGYSEVFVRIPEQGYFSVEIDNQMISSPSGKYRFFDLKSGRMAISIYENGYLIYRSQLNVRNNTRLVLDFFSNYGLYLLDSYKVQGQMYGFDEWDDVWNNPYNNYPSYNPRNNVMDNRSFDSFVQTLKRTASFDKDKASFIEQQVNNTFFTSQQIKTLLETFSFDDSRLQTAKLLYGYCSDISNFYIVYDTFDFDRNRKDLMNFVSKKR